MRMPTTRLFHFVALSLVTFFMGWFVRFVYFMHTLGSYTIYEPNTFISAVELVFVILAFAYILAFTVWRYLTILREARRK